MYQDVRDIRKLTCRQLSYRNNTNPKLGPSETPVDFVSRNLFSLVYCFCLNKKYKNCISIFGLRDRLILENLQDVTDVAFM